MRTEEDNMPKIMVVDDDPYIRELVRILLKSGGFDSCEAFDGRDALAMITGENPDLAIIDLMMPNMDGYELCRSLRKYYGNLPILMLTAKGELVAKAAGFDAGTDDYLTKPFEGDELIMRIRALLRRYKIESSQQIQIGNLFIDRTGYTVTVGDKQDNIPMKEFELLFRLAGFPGRTLSRGQLIEEVWGYDFDGNERTLDVHVGRLRERVPAETSGFRITAVRGLGYKLEVHSEAVINGRI
jgi:DNA-binding response OmpR family regulator